uniref:Uncharacterized protein n=1 Tax=Anopheles atroparvus TaxID=41427 RepID=A0AAG5CXS6_ANOAO
MKKRQSEKLKQLITKVNREQEQNGTNGDQQRDKPKESRKRKRSSGKSGEAGVKKERKDEKTQWIHHLLGPMVRRLTGNPNATYQQRYLHHATLQIPLQPNVLHEGNLFSHFENTASWTVNLPVPLHCTSAGLGPTVPDLMVRFMLVKDNYQRELKSLHKAYKRIESRHTLPGLDLRAVEKDDSIQNSAAVIYAALLDRDPDPYLLPKYGYDYHFTGGSMATIVEQEGSGILATLFTAVGASLEELEIIQLVPSKERDEIATGHVVNCCLTSTPGPILEITADNDGRWVLVRKRHIVFALRQVPGLAETCTTSASDTEWRAVQHVFSAVPFASVCVVRPDSLGKRTLTVCTTDYRRRLRLWEIDGSAYVKRKGDHKLPKIKPSLRAQGGTEGENWSAVRCIDGRSLIGCLDRQRIHLYSIRTDGEKCRESGKSDPDQEVESNLQLEFRGSSTTSRWTMPCERPCALEVAPAEGLIFIATCHKLLVAAVDTSQKPGESQSSSTTLGINVLLVFAHNLQQRPVFISHQRHWGSARADAGSEDENEQHFLLFGSHLPMSYGVCSFEKSFVAESRLSIAPARPKYLTRHLPLHPPTFHDAYRLARARGFCLSAEEPLRQRFTTACQSGMALIPTGNGEEGSLHILLQTSGGDLLQQKISIHGTTDAGDRRESVESVRAHAEQEKVAKTLHRWHERLLQQGNGNPKPYKATNFRTFKKFRDIFNYPEDDLSELKDWITRESSNKNRAKRRARVRASEPSRESSPARSISAASESSCSASVAGADYLDPKPPVARNTAGGSGSSESATPPPWRQTIEELQQYKDVLAPAMLAVWGYGTVGATAPSARAIPEQIPTKLPPYQDVNERVGSWVATAVSNDRLRETEAGTQHDQMQVETPLDFQYTEPLLEPWQERNQTQENDPERPLPKPNNTVYDDPELNILSQAPAIPPSQAFERPAERQAATLARPAKKKYVKGF